MCAYVNREAPQNKQESERGRQHPPINLWTETRAPGAIPGSDGPGALPRKGLGLLPRSAGQKWEPGARKSDLQESHGSRAPSQGGEEASMPEPPARGKGHGCTKGRFLLPHWQSRISPCSEIRAFFLAGYTVLPRRRAFLLAKKPPGLWVGLGPLVSVQVPRVACHHSCVLKPAHSIVKDALAAHGQCQHRVTPIWDSFFGGPSIRVSRVLALTQHI